MTRVKTGETLSRAALAKVARPLERTVHVAILRWLRAEVSALTWHPRNEAGGGRDARWGAGQKALGVLAGTSDLMGVVEYGHPGRLFAVEVKRPGWTASKIGSAQIAFGRMVEDRGGLFTIASSVEEIAEWARGHGIVKPRGWRAPWAMGVGEEMGL